LLQAPAAPAFQRLNRIQRADHLVVHAPQVLFLARAAAAPLPEGRQLGRLDELELLAEVQAHFCLPLAHKPLGRHYQDALHPATQLQLAQHQAGLDGLAEAHLIGQQVADTVAADGAIQCVKLVRQWHHAGLDRRQQQVVLQRIQQLGCRRGVQDLLHARAHAFQRGQIHRPSAHHRALSWQPHAVGDLAPHILTLDHAAGRCVPGEPAPIADGESAASHVQIPSSVRVSARS